MRILIAHSYYQQPGGEDVVFHAERDALLAAGNEVHTYVLHNTNHMKRAVWRQVFSLFWNAHAYQELRRQIKDFKPQVLHVHNLFPFLSPSVLWAARAEKIPVVATLHNYRLLCANGLFYRADSACEKCVGKLFPWPAAVYGCYRKSNAQTLLIVLSMFFHRIIGSCNIPTTFIAPTIFTASKFSSIIPEQRIRVKPHFAYAYSLPPMQKTERVVFVGRLSAEKGFDWLMEAWGGLQADIQLDVVGDGEIPAIRDPRVIFHGRLASEKLHAMLARAAVVVIPSRCYETFSNMVVEAFAAGTAVIAPLGTAPASLVTVGETGAVYARDDVAAFQRLVEEYVNDTTRAEREGKNAHAAYQRKYQAKENVEMLLEIYRRSIKSA